MNNDTICRPPVTSAHVVIGTERYRGNSLLLNYDDVDYSHGYGQVKEAFKALTQDDILQPNISEHDFKSSIDGDNIGYGLYAFDLRYQKNFESAQLIKVEIKFSEKNPRGIYG